MVEPASRSPSWRTLLLKSPQSMMADMQVSTSSRSLKRLYPCPHGLCGSYRQPTGRGPAEGLSELDELKALRSGLRAYAKDVVKHIQGMGMPKTPLEADRTCRMVTSADRMLVQVYATLEKLPSALPAAPGPPVAARPRRPTNRPNGIWRLTKMSRMTKAATATATTTMTTTTTATMVHKAAPDPHPPPP